MAHPAGLGGVVDSIFRCHGEPEVDVTDAIMKAIEESRAKEEKATPEPWVLTGCGSIPDISYWDNYGSITSDELFVAAARTWEPRFREAMASAVKFVQNSCVCEDDTCEACDEIEHIEAILRGEK